MKNNELMNLAIHICDIPYVLIHPCIIRFIVIYYSSHDMNHWLVILYQI